MRKDTEVTPLPEKSERAALVKSGGHVVGSPGRCPVCGAGLRGRQRSCSGKCRAAKSRQDRGEALAVVEEHLTRALARVRGLRGAAKHGAGDRTPGGGPEVSAAEA